MERREFWFLSPGDAMGGDLMPRGKRQVAASAKAHLPQGVTNWIGYYAGPQSNQSINEALAAIGVRIARPHFRLDVGDARVTENPNFGTAWLHDNTSLPHVSFGDLERAARDRHSNSTSMFHAYETFGWAVGALHVRLIDTIHSLAKESLASTECDGHILVVPSIPLLAGLAASVPRAMPLPKPGDVVRYLVDCDPRNARIVDAAYYVCPAV